MRSSVAARRYARALFSIARDEGQVGTIRSELAALANVLDESEALRHAIFRPLHPGSERRAVLKQVCARTGASPVVQNFCSFLVDQRRVVDFEAIRLAYEELADREAGRTKARVTSAKPLTTEQRDRLRRALSSRTGQQIELEESVDPGLLGGAVAQVGGLVFDGSLKTQLEQLRTTLTRGQ
jgi:F-type H+-transporting ATPase subunit delta